MEIKSLIIEDELTNINTLKSFLSEYCTGIINIDEARTVEEAIPKIKSKSPDLIFLDIELPKKNGFELLNYFPNPTFEIIFTTAYSKYAVRAFRMSAVDYLLKPIDVIQLQEAISKVAQKRQQKQNIETYRLLADNLNTLTKRLAVPVQSGYSFIKVDEIIYCEANRSYTTFYLKANKKLVASKPLKWFETTLSGAGFFRINRSFLINLNYLKTYSRSSGGEVVMESGNCFSVSESKREALIQLLIAKDK